MITADLNPPLGKPGGPCQVVNRIVKRVQDKHLQKGLVDEVQQGEDLSNAEASKVYPIEAEPGVGPIHRIVITSHGQYRMDLRGITVDDVQAALASFVKQLAAWKALKSPAYDTFAGRLEGKEHVEWVDPRSKLKVVFAQESPGTVRLITTFWRGQQTAPAPRGTCPVPRKAAMDPLVLRVIARYQRHALAEGPWLPDLLGSKAHLVDEILKAAKRMADEDTWKKGDIKSICGGVCYFLVQIEAGRSVAQKLWNLLDSSAGLDASNKVEGLAHRISNHLDGGAKSKVQAAAIGVSLLQRSKQPTKAQRANAILVDALKLDIDMHGDPGEKSKPQSARVAFAELVKEQLPLARVVWGQVKDVPTAATIAWSVLDDANAREMASITEGVLSPLVKGEVPQDVVREHVGQVSSALHWGIEPSAAFGVAIMEVAGQSAAARKLFSALLKEVAEFLGPGTMFSASTDPESTFAGLVREQTRRARDVWAQLRDVDEAAALTVETLRDCSATPETAIAERVLGHFARRVSNMDDVMEHVGQVAGGLHWDVASVAAFGVALMEAAGQGSLAKRLSSELLPEVQKEF